MIELKNIDVKFSNKEGEITAVSNTNLHVEKGDVYGIVGFSGAGKSTLVRTINLLQRPSSGEVLIKGIDITKLSSRELNRCRKKIGMIFQHYNLMRSRTVLENVLYPLKDSDLSKKDKIEKARKLLELVDILDKHNSYPSQLSGGQKQRVAIARALANDPDILLCDEATSALDPQTTRQILKLLKDLNKKLNLTIVIITHEMQVVKEICNKVAVMEKGKIVENGDIFEVFSSPKENITKNFIQSVSHEDELVEQLKSCNVKSRLGNYKKLYKLKYIGEISQEPVISSLYEKYGIISNIIWGNIEVISGRTIGNLAVIFEGKNEEISKGVKFLIEKGVIVEEIKGI